MKIAMAASECVPFAKTGGLADVIGALPKELAKEGHDVMVFMPFYTVIPEEWRARFAEERTLSFRFGGEQRTCRVMRYEEGSVTFLFIEEPDYFGRDQLYSQPDDGERFAFFCRAVLERLLVEEEQPEVLHVHDWHTGLIPFLLEEDERYAQLRPGVRTLLTIHNLQFQGAASTKVVTDFLELDAAFLNEEKTLWNGGFNALKTGIVYADAISTVSPSYRDEILTERYGEGLQALLARRAGDLFGIVNGIDTEFYNPASDRVIEREYDITSIEQKAVNKRAVQRKFGLPEDNDTPLAVMVSRLAGQKGVDVLQAELPEILKTNEMQFVLLGSGEQQYEAFFEQLASDVPDRAAAFIGFDEQLAHLLYAGADMFLMPSHFEPCGLSQLISMRYGTVPIANKTGGLKDTVVEYDRGTGSGNGFLSDFELGAGFADAIRRALVVYSEPEQWRKVKENGMRGDYSWSLSARKYAELYEEMAGK